MATNKNVLFMFGTLAKYKALETKDPMALYFVTDEDTGKVYLYKGDKLYASDALASAIADGWMSKEDKVNLDNLVANAITGLTPVDGSIVVSNGNKIGVAVSPEAGNILSLKSDGLYVDASGSIDVPEYSIERQAVADEGFNATYKLKKTVNGVDSYVGDPINFAIDAVLETAEFKTVSTKNEPYEGAKVGDPYLDLGFNTSDKNHVYVPLKGLVDTYVAGEGIKIENNVVSINLGSVTNGLHFVDGTLNLALATKDSAGAMSAIDKVALDKLVALDIPTTYGVAYEISNKPTGTLVNYNGKEIRVMCPADTEWALQNVGEGGDSSKYYIGFKAYAPSSDINSFKESLSTTMTDQTMYYFEDNDFAGIDANGRKYSIVWLPVCKHNDDDTWTYYGANSTSDKLIGWNYCVEWYNASGVCVASDLIRINLANEDCVYSIEPYYMSKYVTTDEMIAAMSWDEL